MSYDSDSIKALTKKIDQLATKKQQIAFMLAKKAFEKGQEAYKKKKSRKGKDDDEDQSEVDALTPSKKVSRWNFRQRLTDLWGGTKK